MKRRSVATHHKLAFSFPEAAEISSIGQKQLRRDAKRGDLRALYPTDGKGKAVITRADLEAYLKRLAQPSRNAA
jgi:hypothetical protein